MLLFPSGGHTGLAPRAEVEKCCSWEGTRRWYSHINTHTGQVEGEKKTDIYREQQSHSDTQSLIERGKRQGWGEREAQTTVLYKEIQSGRQTHVEAEKERLSERGNREENVRGRRSRNNRSDLIHTVP